MNFLLKITIGIFLTLSLNATVLSLGENKLDLGMKVGTLGLGLNLSTRIYDKTNVRVNINYFSLSKSINIEKIDYTASLKLLTAGALLDYYFFNGTFRGSFGLYYNGNKLTGTVSLQDKPIKVGDKIYNFSEIGDLSLSLDFQKINPYFGIGWGRAIEETGFSFDCDIGFLYSNSVDVSYIASIKNTTLENEITENLNKEVKKIRSSLDKLKFYPVISLGITYQF